MGPDANSKSGEFSLAELRDDCSRGNVRPIDRLVGVLNDADAAFRLGGTTGRDEALDEALSTISALYGSLELERSPEASTHLGVVYDACLRAVGDAYAGDLDALAAAISMARAVQSALLPAPQPAPRLTSGSRRARRAA